MLTTDFFIKELFRYDALTAGIVSFVCCLILVCTKSWHGRYSLDSTEGMQKFHAAPTPRIGGLAIVGGVFLGFLISNQAPEAAEKRYILGTILLAGVPAFFFGLLEDLTKIVSIKIRLFATMFSGVIGWYITGISLTHVGIPGVDWLLSFSVISIIFTAFAVGGVANSINIIDGFNGLTSGVVLIILGAFGIISRQVGDIPLALTCLVIFGAVAGFFVINWPFGKIFLGDGGAYFLGFAIAWIAVMLPERNSNISPWTCLLICSYPIIEVCFSFIRKTLRVGYSPGEPDGVHLHMLTNKRWIRKLIPNASKLTQNWMTSPFLWGQALISCISAVFFVNNQLMTFVALVFSVVIYYFIYRKLAFFRYGFKNNV